MARTAGDSARKGGRSRIAKRKTSTQGVRRKRSPLAELREQLERRTNELAEVRAQQTATADMLKVISRSVFDLQHVLDGIARVASDLCAADDVAILIRDGDNLRITAHHGSIPIELGTVRPINRNWVSGRAVIDRRPIHVRDLAAADDYPLGRQIAEQFGHRTTLALPLVRDDETAGCILLRRLIVDDFTDRQIALLRTFADQAVIAIGNTRLFEQVQSRTRELSRSLEDLRTAQDRLVQTEKLASLGQLTAGIAHEIKNPLNFVNNFSALSVELTDELNDILKQAELAEKLRTEVDELTGMLKDNLSKVVQHGKRADSIVKNMLLHSREGSRERRSADINSLVRESLNLAYHGARAEKACFSITIKHDFDPDAGALDVYPQEMTRALLNLISNGFYAATRRKVEAGDEIFEPVLSATTRSLGKAVEIRIRDNGIGIARDVREKMFNPFFTTKPTGEGTGLGLSMAHDIIVKQHGGRIDVETLLGEFTEFIITLPRDNGTANS
jgi:two-component system NtrC family sensor kinase